MNDPVLLSHVRELLAQKRKALPPPTDEERVTALFDLARAGKDDLLEEFSMTSPAWREIISGIKDEVTAARRVEFEQRQAIKQRATLALAKPAGDGPDASGNAPARSYAGEKAAWWEDQRTAGGPMPDIEALEEERKADREEAKRKAKLNRQAEFYAQQVQDRIAREEVIKTGATWFGWLRG